MALDESHEVLERPRLFQKLVSIVLDQLSSVDLLDSATRKHQVWASLKSRGSVPVDPSFSLSLLVSVHRTRAIPLNGCFHLWLVLPPAVNLCRWQKHLCFPVLGMQAPGHAILTRPTE